MRSLGVATRALELMLLRATEPKKVAFGKQLREHGVVVANIAESRMEIDQARLMVLSAALQVRPSLCQRAQHNQYPTAKCTNVSD